MEPKYPSYPRCKQVDAGWLSTIPEHWRLAKFKHLFQIRKRIAGSLGFDVLSVTQRGIKVKDIESGDGQLSMDYSKYQLVRKHDFVMNHMDLLTGFVDISKFDGVTSPDYRVFTLEDRGSFRRYFLYLLQMCYFAKIFYPLGQGAATVGRWRLPTDAFNDFLAPTPPLEEQKAIANFLDHETARIDQLIAKQERLIELLKEKRQAVISQAVTKGLNPDVPMKDSGVEWLGEVPAHWSVIQVGRVCRKVADGPHFSPNYVDEGVMFLSARNVGVDAWHLEDAKFVSEDDYREFCRRVTPEKGDVLYTKGGTTGIARVVDLEERFQVWVHVAVLKPNREMVDPYYLAFSLNSAGCYEQSQLHTRGATNQDLGLTRMIKIWFALPPSQEQKQIYEFLRLTLEKIDRLTSGALRGVELLKERRTALISAAVTGKIDVRNWKPTTREHDGGQQRSDIPAGHHQQPDRLGMVAG